jgi:DNA polymerase III alpha subunit
MKVKSAIKDVYRALHGDVPAEIHRICKRLPDAPQGISDYDFVFGYVGADEEKVPGILETDLTLQQFVQQYPSEWAIVVKCLGLVRQKSRHACAYVICNEPVSNFLPTTSSAASGAPSTPRRPSKPLAA